MKHTKNQMCTYIWQARHIVYVQAGTSSWILTCWNLTASSILSGCRGTGSLQSCRNTKRLSATYSPCGRMSSLDLSDRSDTSNSSIETIVNCCKRHLWPLQTDWLCKGLNMKQEATDLTIGIESRHRKYFRLLTYHLERKRQKSPTQWDWVYVSTS